MAPTPLRMKPTRSTYRLRRGAVPVVTKSAANADRVNFECIGCFSELRTSPSVAGTSSCRRREPVKSSVTPISKEQLPRHLLLIRAGQLLQAERKMLAIKAVKGANVSKVYQSLHDCSIETDISYLAPYISTINCRKTGSRKIIDIYNSALQSRYLYNRFLASKRLDLLLEEATKLNLFKVELEWLLFNLICSRKIADAKTWSLLLKQIAGFKDSELKVMTYAVIASFIMSKVLPKGIEFTCTPAYLVLYYCLYYGDVSQLAKINLDELTAGFTDLSKLRDQRRQQRVRLNKGLVLQHLLPASSMPQYAAAEPTNELARERLLMSAGTRRLSDLIKKFNIAQNKEIYFYLIYLHNRSILGLTTSVNLFQTLMSSVW